MARYENGYLGDLSGTLGKAVGSKWRGVAYLRTKARKSSKAKTKKQLEQQARFLVGRTFCKSMRALFTLCFRDQAIKMTGANYGLSQVMNSAITGTYPNFGIDYSKVSVSSGILQPFEEGTVSAETPRTITFTWTTDADRQFVDVTDQALLVAYCPELNEAKYIIGAPRNAGTDTLKVSHFKGKEVHTWVGFMSADGKHFANSKYTGKVTVI